MKMRDLAIWGFLALALVTVFSFVNRTTPDATSSTISYSSLLNEVDAGRVKQVKIVENRATGRMSDNKEFEVVVPRQQTDFIARLEKAGVQITAADAPRTPFLGTLLVNLLPLLIMGGIWFFIMRQMAGGGGKNGAMGFGRSKA